MSKLVCSRCGLDVSERIRGKDRLFLHTHENSYGEKVELNLCWDCDWDVMNGGDPFKDLMDVLMERREQYEEMGLF